MAIIKVKITLNEVESLLVQDPETGAWSGEITAPAITSFNLDPQYYPMEIEITNDAGTVRTYTTEDEDWGTALQMVVKETFPPVITLTSPSKDAYITDNTTGVVFEMTDETDGSGLNLETFKFVFDTVEYTESSTEISMTPIENGYQVKFTPPDVLIDGYHSFTVSVSDHDGNNAENLESGYTIDTTPPILNMSYPTQDFITNQPEQTIVGITNDVTSSPVKITMILNDGDPVEVEVSDGGNFSHTLTLVEGMNTLVVTSTDVAGQSSSVSYNIKLDTSVPTVSSLSITPNPADVSSSVLITLEVE